MSDYLCLEVQGEIIKRLPVKVVLRFRSVSKPWKSLIDSSDFIAAYTHHHTHSHHLLIRYKDPVEIKEKYVCFVDDHTFPHQKFAPTLPYLIEILQGSRIVGSSHGLLCLYSHYGFRDNSGKKEMTVLWNPSITKSVAVAVPDVKQGTVLGFGVCPVTLDPRIVKITQNSHWGHRSQGKSKTTIPWQVEVYTLSSREWRSVSSNLPRPSVEVVWSQVVVDRFIYWSALDIIPKNGRFEILHMIISFDMTSDEFREVALPNCLARNPNMSSLIFKMWESESLSVLETEYEKQIFSIWMMDRNTPNSFTKLFTIKTSLDLIPPPRLTKGWKLLMLPNGFRKSGEPIMEMLEYDHAGCAREFGLAVCEPHSEHITDLGIRGAGAMFCVNSYTESLLLLDQPETFEGGTDEYP